MSIPVADKEPVSLHLDETVKWTVEYSDFPADDGWQLSYTIVGPSGKSTLAFSAEVTQNGTTPGFAVTIPAAKLSTDGVAAAKTYRLFGEVTKAGEKAVVYNGPLEIKPDVSGLTTAYDPRTHAQKVLDAIEATIEGRAGREEASLSVSFGGTTRQLSLLSPDELQMARRQYKQEVADEKAEEDALAGRGRRRIVRARWGNF